jgi:D-beta-D-heptose 7-phosphate kinase / D-beta-D-heptose 1-phosphate adenosyltransferase
MPARHDEAAHSTASRLSVSGTLDPGRKVIHRAEAVERYGRPRDEVVVFTNGCFDILHRGHVEYLCAARHLGHRLVVGINTDASVRRLKGQGRPVLGEDDRAFIIAALECVDAVTLFAEDTPAELVAALLPDILVKGGDYRPDTVVGREVVEQHGGRVVIMPLVEGRSTTTILQRLRQRET